MMCPRFPRADGESYYQLVQNKPWLGYDVCLRLHGVQITFQIRPVLLDRLRLPNKKAELERLALLLPGGRQSELDKLVSVHQIVQCYFVTCPHPLPTSMDSQMLSALQHVFALVLRVLAWLEESYLNADAAGLKKTAGIPCNDHCTLCGTTCKHNANICYHCASDLL